VPGLGLGRCDGGAGGTRRQKRLIVNIHNITDLNTTGLNTADLSITGFSTTGFSTTSLSITDLSITGFSITGFNITSLAGVIATAEDQDHEELSVFPR